MLGRVVGLGQVVQCQLAHAFFAVNREVDGGHQRDQCLVGADVGGSLLPADVLFAGGKREHKAAAAFCVYGFAHQPAGHLPQVLFLGGDHAAIGAAIAERDPERLRFERDDIGFDRRPHHTQRDSLRDRDDQQRTFLVHDLGNGGNVFNDSEKVRRLDLHAGSFFGDALFQGRQVERARPRRRRASSKSSPWCCA